MTKKPAVQLPALAGNIKLAIKQWRETANELLKLKTLESELRKNIAAMFFPAPVEGVNRIETSDGFEIAYNHKVNRTLDLVALDSVMMALPEDSPFRVPDVLITYKPALVMDGFRALQTAPDQLKIFQQALTEKPGMGELEIKLPIMPEDMEDMATVAGEKVVRGSDAHREASEEARKTPAKRGRKPGSKNKK